MSKIDSNHTWNKGIYVSLRTLMHFIAFIQYSYAIYYDYSFVHLPVPDPKRSFGGKFKFLTFINAV